MAQYLRSHKRSEQTVQKHRQAPQDTFVASHSRQRAGIPDRRRLVGANHVYIK
jgi:hypothetical protein